LGNARCEARFPSPNVSFNDYVIVRGHILETTASSSQSLRSCVTETLSTG
jgi:hypothetical protein